MEQFNTQKRFAHVTSGYMINSY